MTSATEAVTPHAVVAPRAATVRRQRRRRLRRVGWNVVGLAVFVVLVFPVFWWSMPALLKGWIDRVFANGWAFGVGEGGGIRPGLGRLTVHLVPVAGSDAALYERRGYDRAFATQIETGILDYCGVRRGLTEFLNDADAGGAAADVDAVVARIAAAVRA